MATSKTYYVTKEQYTILKNGGSFTKDGIEYTWDDAASYIIRYSGNNLYATKEELYNLDYSLLKQKPNISAVGLSGSYADLTNKPDFKPVATSGSYTDLENRPSFKTINGSSIEGSGNITISATPKKTFPTFEDLKNATGLDQTATYVCLDDGCWYYYDGEWKKGSVYQTAVGVVSYSTSQNLTPQEKACATKNIGINALEWFGDSESQWVGVNNNKDHKLFKIFIPAGASYTILSQGSGCLLYPHYSSGVGDGISCSNNIKVSQTASADINGFGFYEYVPSGSAFTPTNVTITIDSTLGDLTQKLGEIRSDIAKNEADIVLNKNTLNNHRDELEIHKNALMGFSEEYTFSTNSEAETITMPINIAKGTTITVTTDIDCRVYMHKTNSQGYTHLQCIAGVPVQTIAEADLIGFSYYASSGVSSSFKIKIECSGAYTQAASNKTDINGLKLKTGIHDTNLYGTHKSTTISTVGSAEVVSIDFPISKNTRISIQTDKEIRLYAHADHSKENLGVIVCYAGQTTIYTAPSDLVGFGHYVSSGGSSLPITVGLSVDSLVEEVLDLKEDVESLEESNSFNNSFLWGQTKTVTFTSADNKGADIMAVSFAAKKGSIVSITASSSCHFYPHKTNHQTLERITCSPNTPTKQTLTDDIVGFGFYASSFSEPINVTFSVQSVQNELDDIKDRLDEVETSVLKIDAINNTINGKTITKSFSSGGQKEDKVFDFIVSPGAKVIITSEIDCYIYPHTTSGEILSGIMCNAGKQKEITPTTEWSGLAYYVYGGVQSSFSITVQIVGFSEDFGILKESVSSLEKDVDDTTIALAMNQSVIYGNQYSQTFSTNNTRDNLAIQYPVKKDTRLKITSTQSCVLYPHNSSGYTGGASISCSANTEVEYLTTEDLVGFSYYKYDGVTTPFTIDIEHEGIQSGIAEFNAEVFELTNTVKEVAGSKQLFHITTNRGDKYLSIKFPVKAGVEVSITTTQNMRIYAQDVDGNVIGNTDIKTGVSNKYRPTKDIIGFGNYASSGVVNADVEMSFNGISQNNSVTIESIKDDFLGNSYEWTINGKSTADIIKFPVHLKLGQKIWIDSSDGIVLYPHNKSGIIKQKNGDSRRISLIAGSHYCYEAEDDILGFAYYSSKDPTGTVIKITKAPINYDFVNTPQLPDYYFPYLKYRTEEIKSYWETCSANTDAFFFITDMHYDEHMQFNAGNSLEMIKYIRQQLPIHILLQGGDFFNWGLYANIAPELEKALGEKMVYSAYGNHEFMHKDSYGKAAIYYHTIANNMIFGDNTRTFGYADIPGKQLRIIVLGSYGKYDGEVYDKIYDYESQYNWFTTKALNLPNGYNAIILTHDLYTCSHSEPRLGLTGGADRYVDFINQNADKVICVLNGHTHADRIHYGETGVPYIVSQCDTLKEAGVGPVPREKGTVTEQHFEVAIVDRENKTIKLFSIGSQCQNGLEEDPGELADSREVTFVAN